MPTHGFEYLSSAQVSELHELAAQWAQRAEEILAELGPRLRKDAQLLREKAAAQVPSRIPNHPLVSYETPVISNFVAIVTDIRKSSDHLRIAIRADYSQVERVFFETSLALPVFAKVMEFFGGATTEYLGDGTLALFEVGEANAKEGCTRAYRSGVSAIDALRSVVNPLLQRHRLPDLRAGVGIGRSRALVSAIGLADALQATAFGQCVFYASKLSKWGTDEIYCDDAFQKTFTRVEGGRMRFRKRTRDEIDGFLVSRSN